MSRLSTILGRILFGYCDFFKNFNTILSANNVPLETNLLLVQIIIVYNYQIKLSTAANGQHFALYC
jgi:hypothetical protein